MSATPKTIQKTAYPHIVKVEGVCGGAATIEGTRSPRLAEQLRKHGFDVTSTQELGLLAASDDEQLAHTCAEQRAILTFNVGDFVALHNQYIANGKEPLGHNFVLPRVNRRFTASHTPPAEFRHCRRTEKPTPLAQRIRLIPFHV